jgi:hypothetical protein
MQMPWDQRYKEGPKMQTNKNGEYEEDDFEEEEQEDEDE